MATALEQSQEELKKNFKPVADFVEGIPGRMKAKKDAFDAEKAAGTDNLSRVKNAVLNEIEVSQQGGNAYGIADYAADSINQQGGVMPISRQAQQAYAIKPTDTLPAGAIASSAPATATPVAPPAVTSPVLGRTETTDSNWQQPGFKTIDEVSKTAIPAAAPVSALTVKKVGDGYIVKKADGSVHLTNKPLEYGTQEEIDAGLLAGKGNKTWFNGPAGGNPTETAISIPDYKADYAKETAAATAQATGPAPSAIPGQRNASRDRILGKESEGDYVARRAGQDLPAIQGGVDRRAADELAIKTSLLQDAEVKKATLHAAVQENLYAQAIKNKDNDLLLMLAGVGGKSAIPKREDRIGSDWNVGQKKVYAPDGMTVTGEEPFYYRTGPNGELLQEGTAQPQQQLPPGIPPGSTPVMRDGKQMTQGGKSVWKTPDGQGIVED